MKTRLFCLLFLVLSIVCSQDVCAQYCYEDNLNNNCESAVHDMFVEVGNTNAVESCGDCPGPTPQVPVPVCPTANMKEFVADKAIPIVFAIKIDPKSGAKDDVSYHTAQDCGLVNTCKTNCIAVIQQNGVRFKCDKDLLTNDFPIQPRTADGHRCRVFQ